MKTTSNTLLVSTALLLSSTALLQAQAVGYVGGSASYIASDSIDSDFVQGARFDIELGYISPLANGDYLALDGALRFDASDDEITGHHASDLQFQLGAIYLHPLAGGAVIGGFIGAAAVPFDNHHEYYQIAFIGAQIMQPVSSNIALFGQGGFASSFDHDEYDSAGFYNGWMVRVGASYSGINNTVLRVEGEVAASEMYEDDSEPGEMWSVAMLGETLISGNQNWVASYSARYGFYDALNDSDAVGETTVSVGVKYMFGGATPQSLISMGYIGLPTLPWRASFYTPEMD